MKLLLPEFKELLLLLLKHKVNFIIIGGYAVIYYGYERTTNDLDIWLEPSNENKELLLKALVEFEVKQEDLNALKKYNFTQPHVFYFGKKPRRIDFLTKISGIDYKEAAPQVNYFPLGDQKVPVIQYHHLILSKIANARLKDKADVEELQRINKYKNKTDT